MRTRGIVVMAAGLALAVLPSLAAIPQTMSYQGLLTDLDGNPVSDGSRLITIKIWDAANGGNTLWTENQNVETHRGVFNAVLGTVTPLNLAFDVPYWLSTSIEGGADLAPRVPLTTAPYAFHAAVADVGQDADWVIVGNDIYHLTGNVAIGTTLPARDAPERAKPGSPPLRERDPAKFLVLVDDDLGIAGRLTETNNAADGRAAIYGYRTELVNAPGSNYSVSGTNNAVTGYNYWGEAYTFGVAGYCYNDFTLTGGVLGSDYDGSHWGSLGYKDANSRSWGLYTPSDVYIGGSLGVGTTSPAAKLEVQGDDVAIRASSPSMTTRWIEIAYNPYVGPLLRGGAGYSRLTLDAYQGLAGKIVLGVDGDNVGIGVQDPANKLEVAGTAQMTGFRMTTSPTAGYILTSDATGNGTWQAAPGTGDITAVYADNGLGGGATSGDAHLSVNPGTGLEVSGDNVQLTTAYSSGSAYDARFVNESQANAISSGMIQTGAATFEKLSDPLNIAAGYWDWDLTSGEIDIDITSSYPAINIESTCTTYGDCLYLSSSASAGTSTWVLYAYTLNGNAGFFSKATDDNTYCVYVASPGSTSEGVYVNGTIVASGTKSAVVETSQGREAVFCVESPEVEIYTSGTARLTAGQAQIRFDRLFSETISAQIPVKVTVTPAGAWSALFIESRDTEGFVVRSASGDAEVAFDWMACGRRKGYDVRPQISIPDPQEPERMRQEKLQARG